MNLYKKLLQYLSKRLEERSINRYYSTIEDMPVHSWWKIHESGDFKWLLKSKHYKVNDIYKYKIKIKKKWKVV